MTDGPPGRLTLGLSLRVLGLATGVVLMALLSFGLGFVFGEDAGEAANRPAGLDAAKPGDRRLDPETGCDALAAGIRALVTDGSGRHAPEVRAVLLDALLLNYRNLECGIDRRSRLLLELVPGPAGN